MHVLFHIHHHGHLQIFRQTRQTESVTEAAECTMTCQLDSEQPQAEHAPYAPVCLIYDLI